MTAAAAEVEITIALRELLDQFTRMDAVERGLAHQRKMLFNPNHYGPGARGGQFAPSAGGGEDEGLGHGGNQHGSSAHDVIHEGGTAGAGRKAGGSVTPKSPAAPKAPTTKTTKTAAAKKSAAPAKPALTEEEISQARIAAAQKRVSSANRAYTKAEKASTKLKADNADEINRLRGQRRHAAHKELDSHSAAKDAIAEQRAEAKGQSGKAPKTYEKMLAARQHYLDAKAEHEAADAKAKAANQRVDDLNKQYADDYKKVSQWDAYMKAHPDLKAAYREKWKADGARDKAQRLLWRKEGVYQTARGKLAGEIKDDEIEAHPLRVEAKAKLAKAEEALGRANGETALRAAYDERAAAQSALKEAYAAHDVLSRSARYTLSVNHVTTHASHTDLTQWSNAELDRAFAEERAGLDRIANGETANRVGDLALAHLQHEQGYDGKPEIVREGELEQAIKNGDIEVWRGDSNRSASYTDQYMMGDHHTGLGIRGNGTYGQEGADGHQVARGYATDRGNVHGDKGLVMRMSIKGDARVITLSDLNGLARSVARQAEHDKQAALTRGDKAAAHRADRLYWLATSERGGSSRLAAALGYDAIRIPAHGQVIILNRTAVRISNWTRRGSAM